MAVPVVVDRAYRGSVDTLRRNETLSELFGRHGIVGRELLQLLKVADGLNPRRLPSGLTFQLRYPLDESEPDRITVRLNDERVLRLRRDTSGLWMGESVDVVWTAGLAYAGGAVEGSLYETVHRVIDDSVLPFGERDRLVSELADGIYGWVVDFYRDLYPGDQFSLLYERLTSDLGDVRFGRILAARIETRGTENPAYLMTDARGRNSYYDAEGTSLRRAFKLYPAEFRYISSGFSRSRFHPVLRVRRPHLGVDYRAARGTPVIATGDGTVVRAGRWGGYGIMVAIRHAHGIETRYAHLSGLAAGIRPGVRVRQGQTIGRVGMTGLATAPHVHYEFIQHGKHVDPRSARRYGSGDPVPAARRAEFDSLRVHYDRLLAQLSARFATARVD
ncbi:MAG: M23 family metallopeptidase [Gemmatimonadales bacterium]